jgi:hypothetical protein
MKNETKMYGAPPTNMLDEINTQNISKKRLGEKAAKSSKKKENTENTHEGTKLIHIGAALGSRKEFTMLPFGAAAVEKLRSPPVLDGEVV